MDKVIKMLKNNWHYTPTNSDLEKIKKIGIEIFMKSYSWQEKITGGLK